MKIYAVSGLGANEKIFENLHFPANCTLIYLPWILPKDNESISDYAIRIAEQIDESEEFILMGISFGGLIVQEIARHKKPSKILLFNTIKSESEKPLWISINRWIPIYKFFPYFILNETKFINYIAQVQLFINKNRPNLSELYSFRQTKYTKWAFLQIINWESLDNSEVETHHIHGTRDFVFPIWNITNPIKIPKGGHLAIYEKSDIVNRILEEIL